MRLGSFLSYLDRFLSAWLPFCSFLNYLHHNIVEFKRLQEREIRINRIKPVLLDPYP
jgi:hypothetical protein